MEPSILLAQRDVDLNLKEVKRIIEELSLKRPLEATIFSFFESFESFFPI